MRDMRVGLLVLAAALNSSPASAEELDLSAVKEHCAEEWKSDFSMQAYCIKQNKEGYSQYKERLSNNKIPELEKSFETCEREWGHQWDMVAYCSRNMTESFKKIPALLTGLPNNISKTISTRCASEWLPDYSMVAYCVGEQVNGQ